ncbi:hypothetical protein ACWEHA_00550 [Amycolatopsis nivea]
MTDDGEVKVEGRPAMIDQEDPLLFLLSPERPAEAARPGDTRYLGDPVPHSAEHAWWAESDAPLVPDRVR